MYYEFGFGTKLQALKLEIHNILKKVRKKCVKIREVRFEIRLSLPACMKSFSTTSTTLLQPNTSRSQYFF